jgi:hypothetical protein
VTPPRLTAAVLLALGGFWLGACSTAKIGAGADGGAAGVGGAGGTSSGGSGGTGSGGSAGTSSGGSVTTGGTGGSGGGGPCTDGATEPCYDGLPGTDGVGVCAKGTHTCQAGDWGVCQGQVLPSDVEDCNGLDDDCDGLVDEDLGQTSCGLGSCQVTVDNCESGQAQTCTPKTGSTTEQCDGVDDNCDGTVDEGCSCVNGTTQSCYSGPSNTNGVGLCHGGTQTCSNGAWGNCVGEVKPKAELCNGKDDDCDGTADDGNPQQGQACDTGKLGVCKTGSATCSGGTLLCNQTVQPSTETCDGQDNDCDGTVDDGNPGGGQSCNTGMSGICAAGTTQCSSGSIVCQQNAQPTTEICDGKDNNCNGTTDEGCQCVDGQTQACYTGPAGTQNVGICKGGTATCSGGQWGSCVGQVVPKAEVCSNTLDDDCNGVVNNGCGTTGLIIHYELEQASGTNVPNSATGQPNGTLNGAYAWATPGGAPGSTYELSILAGGVNNVATNLPSTAATNLTVEYFWRYEDVAGLSIPYMFYQTSNSFRAFTNGVAGTGIYVRATPGGSDVILSTNVQDGKWHHIAYVLNASAGSGTLYFDGANVGSTTYSGAITLDSTLYVCGSSGTNYAKVGYDRFRIWSSALSQSQIASIISGSL